MKNSQKENQPSKLNQPIPKHRKNHEHNRLTHREHNDYYDKISILKQSALQALAEKNEVIEVLTNSLNHQQQLTCSLTDQKAEDRAFFDLLMGKINQKNEEVECARQQIKKKEMQVQQLKESVEYGQWQKQQLLQQLERYELENQDLRQIITELVTENQKLKELLRYPHHSSKTERYNHSSLNSLAQSAAKEDNLQTNRNENNVHLQSVEQQSMESEIRQNRSPALNVLLLQRTGSIAEFTNLCQENDFIDFNEHSVTQGMKESLVKKHCLALSLKAINLIDTYSLNSTSKKITDYESQLTARYFQYVNEKDVDRGCEANSVGDLQMQSYEDIMEQPEQAEQEVCQEVAKSDVWDVLSKLRWAGLGMLLGSTLVLLFKR